MCWYVSYRYSRFYNCENNHYFESFWYLANIILFVWFVVIILCWLKLFHSFLTFGWISMKCIWIDVFKICNEIVKLLNIWKKFAFPWLFCFVINHTSFVHLKKWRFESIKMEISRKMQWLYSGLYMLWVFFHFQSLI